MIEIVTASKPDPERVEQLWQSLLSFNEQRVGPSEPLLLSVFVLEDSEIVGGANGYTRWGWLYVGQVWVAERLRGQRLGSRVLTQIETAAASERACHSVYLDTYSWQARGFYERHGYEVFATLPQFPSSEARYFLRKTLGSEPCAGEC